MPRESDILDAIDNLATASRRARPFMGLGLLAIFAGFIFFSIYSNSLRVKAEEQAESRRQEAESWRRQAESWRRRTDAVQSLLEQAQREESAGNRQQTNELLREASAQTQRLSNETTEAAGPPSLRDSAWSNVPSSDPSGNVYAIRRDDVGNTTSPRRRIWVRGDHSADQTILHRYSLTLWRFDCANRRAAPGRRVNYHADDSVDSRAVENPEIPQSVITALSDAVCR